MSSVRSSIVAVSFGWLLAGCQASPPANDVPAAPTPAEPLPESIALPSCGTGTMTSVARNCAPVGPRTIPKGFQKQTDVWGFKAIAPWGICTPNARSAIGTGRCTPVDDCADAFPPAGAAIVHDQAQLVAALADAKDGATIALEEGTYESVVLPRSVNLIGRCASKVVFHATGADQKGIGVDGAKTVTLQSLRLEGFAYGLWAGGGAKVSVERTVFDENDVAAWIVSGTSLDFRESLVAATSNAMPDGILVGRGSHAVVADSELRRMHIALQAFADSTVDASGVIVSDPQERAAEELAALVVASKGSRVELDRSLVIATKTFAAGASATDPRESGSAPSTLHVSNSEILRVDPTNAGGFDVLDGSTLELDNVTFETRARIAITADNGANVSLSRTVIRPVLATDAARRGVGAGIELGDDARLTMEDSAVLEMSQSAILASKGTHSRVARSLIARTWEFERRDFDKRFHSGQAISLSGTASLELSDSTLQDNAGTAIWMDGGEPSLRIERSAILDTRGSEASTAVAGVVAWSGTVDVAESLLHGVPDTALALGNVTGAVAKTVISKSDVAFRWLGDTRLVTTSDEARRPERGEIVDRGNVLVDTRAREVDESLAAGDCRCDVGKK